MRVYASGSHVVISFSSAASSKDFVVGFRVFGGMELQVLSEKEICHVHAGTPTPNVTVACYVGGPTHARYVYIYLPGLRTLLLCEVEVYEFTGWYIIRLILGLRPANERRRYFVTASLIAWAQA